MPSLWSISIPGPGTQCPQGGSQPSPAGSAPSLGSFSFPKGNASLGLPSLRVWKGHWGTHCSQSRCCGALLELGVPVGRPALEDKGPPRCGNLVQALPQHVPCPGSMGTGMHLDFCTGTAQPQLLGLPMGSNPRQCFYLFDPKQPLACCSAHPGQLSAPPSIQPHPSSGGSGKDL